ncbi:hypothetical protein EVAR_19454_1 [Eumeta japonica]|uniref:Uncharacterized protein n=1 Tax=Eumeta variegata TaxID=151549 RepID=A0A4C1VB98_EUMVA|nr:hypothetical protein EVAR_19454_1 [Eumeta japonica]
MPKHGKTFRNDYNERRSRISRIAGYILFIVHQGAAGRNSVCCEGSLGALSPYRFAEKPNPSKEDLEHGRRPAPSATPSARFHEGATGASAAITFFYIKNEIYEGALLR